MIESSFDKISLAWIASGRRCTTHGESVASTETMEGGCRGSAEWAFYGADSSEWTSVSSQVGSLSMSSFHVKVVFLWEVCWRRSKRSTNIRCAGWRGTTNSDHPPAPTPFELSWTSTCSASFLKERSTWRYMKYEGNILLWSYSRSWVGYFYQGQLG